MAQVATLVANHRQKNQSPYSIKEDESEVSSLFDECEEKSEQPLKYSKGIFEEFCYEYNIEASMDVNTPTIFDKYPDEECEVIKDEQIVEDERQAILIQGNPITHNPRNQ